VKSHRKAVQAISSKPSLPSSTTSDINTTLHITIMSESTEKPLPPPSLFKRAPDKIDMGAGKADKTQDGYENATNYINHYLRDHSLPMFEELNDEDVEVDHLQNFIENIMH
jgi:hypothetical protein